MEETSFRNRTGNWRQKCLPSLGIDTSADFGTEFFLGIDFVLFLFHLRFQLGDAVFQSGVIGGVVLGKTAVRIYQQRENNEEIEGNSHGLVRRSTG